MTNQSLVERDTKLVTAQQLVGIEIKTPQEYAERIRQLQGQAHILSPMSAVASIAPSHIVNPMIVVIDPSVDPKSGRGADVYHQRSIHKGQGRGDDYVPLEVSLNKIGLIKILSAAGVNVYPTERLDDGTERNLWIMRTQGDILDFDGRYRLLPPVTASVDLRDGSADIGEWTPEAWAEAVRVADVQKSKTPPDDRWKVKCDVNGWTYDRVLQARKYGLRMCEAKSLNALTRNLGIKQAYAIMDLQKPFVIFRATYVPDLTNPRVAEMYAAANLGARMTLYPGTHAPVALGGGPITHGPGDPTDIVPGEITHETPDQMLTAAPPEDVEELTLEESKADVAKADIYHIVKVTTRGKGAEAQYFVETLEGVTLYTPDHVLAKAYLTAKKDGLPREIPTERIMVQKQPYRQIVEIMSVGGLNL